MYNSIKVILSTRKLVLIRLMMVGILILISSLMAINLVLLAGSVNILDTTLIELKNEQGKIVYHNRTRLPNVLLPEELERGSYNVYADGVLLEKVDILGTEKERIVEDGSEDKKTHVLNIEVYKDSYMLKLEKAKEAPGLLISYRQIQEELIKKLGYVKIIIADVNAPIIGGVFLLSIFCLALHVSAIPVALLYPDTTISEHLKEAIGLVGYTAVRLLPIMALCLIAGLILYLFSQSLGFLNQIVIITLIISFILAVITHQLMRIAFEEQRLIEGILIGLAVALITGLALVIDNKLLAVIAIMFTYLVIPAYSIKDEVKQNKLKIEDSKKGYLL